MGYGLWQRFGTIILIESLLLLQFVQPAPAHAQFSKLKQKFTEVAVCGAGAAGGYKLGQKFGQAQAAKMHLPPAEAQAMQRKYEIGLAMALCKGGSAVAGTIFAKLSEKDKKAREDEINSALAESAPTTKTYPVPDQPTMTETITTQPIVTADNGNECRVMEDNLADGADKGTALVKYCRKPPDGSWNPSTTV